MEVRITTLSENTATYGFWGEWGLSILVEAGDKKILLDTGPGFSTVHNASLLGIDLTDIDRIVLSHGHADHTGGLLDVLKSTGPKEIVAHPNIWAGKYVSRGGEEPRYIGIPFTREELEASGASFILSREPVELSDHIITTGEIPAVNDFESIDPGLLAKEGEEQRGDELADDLALIVKTDFGLVVILGCAHRGIINTLHHARILTGEEQVYAVIGGAHLFNSSPERLAMTSAALRDCGVQRLGLSHCTGFAASAYLAQAFGDSFFLNNAGTRFTLPF